MARKDGALGRSWFGQRIDCDQWIAEKRPQMGAGSAESGCARREATGLHDIDDAALHHRGHAERCKTCSGLAGDDWAVR
jgi:hypothetical protein